ncbi:MAG: 5-formyltetrahydrofolate cyclo-ligase [Candidatus Nanopelagicales bacterium]
MDKSQIRAQIRATRRDLRRQLGEQGWHDRSTAIAQALLERDAVAQACAAGATVASYEAVFNEPPTDRLNRALAEAGARVVVPVVEHDGVAHPELAWADLADPERSLVAFGAAGLTAIGCEVVIVPALAISDSGQRLGQGGGYYDRMFAGFVDSHGPLRLALVGPGEARDDLKIEPHDQLVDGYVIG